MPAKNSNEPHMLEIRKYPNRRYYDATRSRHITLQQIHKLIHEGYNIRVVDAKTNEDITSQILTQILLEYEPVKLDLFSNELLTRAIRVSDRLLKDFVDVYFHQAFEAFCGSQKQVDQVLRHAHQLKSVFPSITSLAGNLFPPWMPQAKAPEESPEPPEPENAPGKVEDELAKLREELATLKAQVQERARPRRKRKKS